MLTTQPPPPVNTPPVDADSPLRLMDKTWLKWFRSLVDAINTLIGLVVQTFSTRGGTVLVIPAALVGGVATVLAPNGSQVSTAGTVTQGLQEAITYACANGYDLHVLGGDEGPGGAFGAIVYNCGAGLEFPPMQGKSIRFDAVTLNFGAIGSPYGLRFNSCMMVDLDMAGAQVVNSDPGSAHGILFKPEAGVPLDHITVIVDSKFKLPTVAKVGGNALTFDLDLGSIVASEFSSPEINGGDIGVCVLNPPINRIFEDNQFRCPHVHEQGVVSMQIGGSPLAGGARVGGNLWMVGISTESATVAGIDTFGTDDTWIVTSIQGPVAADALTFEAEASGNRVFLGPFTGNLSDLATLRTNRLWCPRDRTPAAVVPSGSPFVYPTAADVAAGGSLSDQIVTVTGAGTTLLEVSPDGGATYLDTGVTAGLFALPPGTQLRVTYGAAPTVTRAIIG